MGFNEFLSSIFGNKSTRDMKEIKPWVEKIKAAYPEIEKLDNDALRAKTEELKKYIHESATAERAKVEELKASIESLELEDREEVFAQIDKIEKEILDKYEKALDEVLPVAFSIVKATAKRFTENEEIVVTATDFDRQLAATKDFVRIEGDKAIYQNHWIAGGNDTVWNMVHYDVQLFGGVVLHKGKIAARELLPVQLGRQAVAGQSLEICHLGGGQVILLCLLQHSAGQRVFTLLLQGSGKAHQYLLRHTVCGQDIRHARLAAGDGASFI